MRCQKCYFSIFAFFIFSNLKWPLLKSYGKMIFFYNGFRGFLWSYTMSQIFLTYIFLTMKQRPFYIFWYFHGNAFCFFIFLNERNITTSHLMIHLKCTGVHHANLNSSSKNKPHLRATEHAISFIQFLIYVYINKAFVKNFMKKLLFFNTNFQNSFQDVLYCRILVCQTLWY